MGNAGQGKKAELMMRFSKDELFDPVVQLPHIEINDGMYDRVDRFMEGQHGVRKLSITILSDGVEPLMQDHFREIFAEHYDEEYRKLKGHIRNYLIKILILVLISGPALLAWEHIQDGVGGYCSKHFGGSAYGKWVIPLWTISRNGKSVGRFAVLRRRILSL